MVSRYQVPHKILISLCCLLIPFFSPLPLRFLERTDQHSPKHSLKYRIIPPRNIPLISWWNSQIIFLVPWYVLLYLLTVKFQRKTHHPLLISLVRSFRETSFSLPTEIEGIWNNKKENKQIIKTFFIAIVITWLNKFNIFINIKNHLNTIILIEVILLQLYRLRLFETGRNFILPAFHFILP